MPNLPDQPDYTPQCDPAPAGSRDYTRLNALLAEANLAPSPNPARADGGQEAAPAVGAFSLFVARQRALAAARGVDSTRATLTRAIDANDTVLADFASGEYSKARLRRQDADRALYALLRPNGRPSTPPPPPNLDGQPMTRDAVTERSHAR